VLEIFNSFKVFLGLFLYTLPSRIPKSITLFTLLRSYDLWEILGAKIVPAAIPWWNSY
jgi:hypothetical protein